MHTRALEQERQLSERRAAEAAHLAEVTNRHQAHEDFVREGVWHG